MANRNNFFVDHDYLVFGSAVTLDTNLLSNSSDFTAVSTHEWDRLAVHWLFPSAPAAGDTSIVFLEMASASSNNDSDFTAFDTANISLAVSPGADSTAALGSVLMDIDLKAGGASRFVRPIVTGATGAAGVSVANVAVIGILYGGSGMRDHESVDTTITVNY